MQNSRCWNRSAPISTIFKTQIKDIVKLLEQRMLKRNCIINRKKQNEELCMELIRKNIVVYVPYMKIKVKFFEKEDVALNAFQKFILEAVMEGASVQQIVDSTQFTKNVVETELLQMQSQKLIIQDKSQYYITDVSKKIMLVSKMVTALNAEHNIFCINLISGEIEKCEEGSFCIPEKNEYKLRQKMLNLDSISIEENMEFFAENIEIFNEIEVRETQMILSSIYAEFNAIKEHGNKSIIYYKKQSLIGLPCLIGEEQIKITNRETSILVEAACKLISFSFYTDSIVKYESVIPELYDINIKYPELISDGAKNVIYDKQLCESYNKKNIEFVYDCTSGKYRLSNEININTEKRKAQFVIDEVNPLNEEVEAKMINEVKEMLDISSEDIFVQIYVKDNAYKMETDFGGMMEES